MGLPLLDSSEALPANICITEGETCLSFIAKRPREAWEQLTLLFIESPNSSALFAC